MLTMSFGVGEMCHKTCVQAHNDIFNKNEECRLAAGGMKLDLSDNHSKATLVFLLKHFNSNLRDLNGCKICPTDSGDRKTSLPDKAVDPPAQNTIKAEFAKLKKHCEDHHNLMLDFLHGLGLL